MDIDCSHKVFKINPKWLVRVEHLFVFPVSSRAVSEGFRRSPRDFRALPVMGVWNPVTSGGVTSWSRGSHTALWLATGHISHINYYLLVLGVVEAFCSLSGSARIVNFFPIAFYNSINTICNFLFVIILNKHKYVTRYVFYISVCMICAYIESDVVALFYFALNSQGSLQNVKLTAIRTAAITLTLTVSFRTSMHIIRKLIKPRQSLFEGLGEQWVLHWHRYPDSLLHSRF